MCQIFQFKKKMYPRGKFYWRSLVDDIDWKRSWLLPGKYCISNKAKETHLNFLHKIYPVNLNVSKYLDIDSSCSFSKQAEESLEHYYDNTKNKPLEHTIQIIILYGKFFIHKQKFANSHPSYLLFTIELNSLLKSLHLIKNKKTKIPKILYRDI